MSEDVHKCSPSLHLLLLQVKCVYESLTTYIPLRDRRDKWKNPGSHGSLCNSDHPQAAKATFFISAFCTNSHLLKYTNIRESPEESPAGMIPKTWPLREGWTNGGCSGDEKTENGQSNNRVIHKWPSQCKEKQCVVFCIPGKRTRYGGLTSLWRRIISDVLETTE